MRVQLVADARGEVGVVGLHAHARNVEVGLVEIAADLVEDRRDQPLRLGVVDERRLQRRDDLDELLDGELELRGTRVERRERGLDELAGEFGEGTRALARA